MASAAKWARYWASVELGGVRLWEVRTVGYRDKHRVIGGISNRGLCECLHEGVEADEVGVPTAEVALKCVNEAHDLDDVLLGCRSPFVLEASEDGEELYLGVACDWGGCDRGQ